MRNPALQDDTHTLQACGLITRIPPIAALKIIKNDEALGNADGNCPALKPDLMQKKKTLTKNYVAEFDVGSFSFAVIGVHLRAVSSILSYLASPWLLPRLFALRKEKKYQIHGGKEFVCFHSNPP